MKIRIISLFVLLSLVIGANAQSKISKKTKKLYEKGIKAFNKHNYPKSLKYFDKVIKKSPDFIRPHLYKASAYYELKQYDNSKKEYQKVLGIDSTYSNSVYYSLGLVCEKMKDYKEALNYYRIFLNNTTEKGKKESKASEKVKNLPFIIDAMRHPVDFDPVALDKTINSDNSEYLPSLTGDNSQMIFTRRVNRQEDLYTSKFIDGKWQEAIPVQELNTAANEGIQSLSSDGQVLLMTVCARGKTYGNCDLFISNKVHNHWSKPKNLGAIINSPYWDSQPSISSDNKTLYFSSNRPGGIGGKDIWVSYLENNKWSKPICLDSTINTPADEQTPFIHSDNTTLYFTSNGHPGMGGTDLYYSKKINGKWNKAVNLGYPINTEYDEGALFVSLDGKSGYMSADRSNHNNRNIDIYYFEMPDKIKPNPVTYVKGIVFDKSTNAPIIAKIQLSNNDNGKFIRTIETTKDSFFVALQSGIDYNFSVQKEGYTLYSDRFVLEKSNSQFNPFRLSIGLAKLENNKEEGENTPIVLHNIFFETNSSKLDKSRSKIELENLLTILKRNKEISMEILGHTDNTGSYEYNKTLSIQRAKAVYDYLITAGIEKARLNYTGFGDTKPLVTNDSDENRSKNRRVEFRIIYHD